MMDIKYDFKGQPFKGEKDGKPVLYPAVVVKGNVTTDHIVKELSKHSAYSAGCGGSATGGGRYGLAPIYGKEKMCVGRPGYVFSCLPRVEVTDRKEIRHGIREDKEGELPSGAGTEGEAGAAGKQTSTPCRVRLLCLRVKKRSKEERWTVLEAYLKNTVPLHVWPIRNGWSGAYYGCLSWRLGMRRRDWTKKESILMRCMCCASKGIAEV